MIFSKPFRSAAIVLFVSAAAIAAPENPPAPDPAPSPAHATTPGKAVWEPTYEKARARATSEGKLVFIEFTGEGCGNCVRMDSLLYPAVNFEMTLLRMVPVKLDRTVGEGAALAERYGITESPAVLILSSGGALVFRVNGFDQAPAFYAHVRESMAAWDKIHVRMIHEPEFIGDPKEELALGTELALRYDPEEAAPRFERASEAPGADAATRDLALTYLASARFKLKKYTESRATLGKILLVSKDADLREQAELFVSQIALAEGKRAEARRTVMAFLRDHPGSARVPAARKMLASMNGTED